MSVITDEKIRSIILREAGSFVPRGAVALTDDLKHDLRLLSDDGAQFIIALEQRLGVDSMNLDLPLPPPSPSGIVAASWGSCFPRRCAG